MMLCRIQGGRTNDGRSLIDQESGLRGGQASIITLYSNRVGSFGKEQKSCLRADCCSRFQSLFDSGTCLLAPGRRYAR